MLCLCFSASLPLGPCPSSHTPECAVPRSPFRSHTLSFKMVLAHFAARCCLQASICVCTSSVVVTLKFVELFCFDRTVTSQNLLLTKNICTTIFFFHSFSIFKKRHYILQLNIRPQEGTLRLCFAPC